MSLNIKALNIVADEKPSSPQASSSPEKTIPPQTESSQAREAEDGPPEPQLKNDSDRLVLRRTVNGRFRHGVSGNPAGRPLGSRNRNTLALQELLNEHGEIIVKKAVEMTLEGNEKALQLTMERLVAPVKERVVPFNLPTPFSMLELEKTIPKVFDETVDGFVSPVDTKILLESILIYLRSMTGRF
jgi:hypothetical protein